MGSCSIRRDPPLSGATVTLSGIGAPQTQLSDAQGQQGHFRFVGLAPGAYRLQAHQDGFSPVDHDKLIIHVGRNTDVEVTLPAAISAALTVEAEAPLLDERRFSKGNTFTLAELERVPTARDPWSVISSTPGVLLDRINVGGSETGAQARIVGPAPARRERHPPQEPDWPRESSGALASRRLQRRGSAAFFRHTTG
jgi:hypothetical protein